MIAFQLCCRICY